MIRMVTLRIRMIRMESFINLEARGELGDLLGHLPGLHHVPQLDAALEASQPTLGVLGLQAEEFVLEKLNCCVVNRVVVYCEYNSYLT